MSTFTDNLRSRTLDTGCWMLDKLSRGMVLACLLTFATLLAGIPARADADATILQKVDTAATKYSYKATGTTTVLYRGRMISSQIRFFHDKSDMCRIEYTSPPLKGLVAGMCSENSWRYDPKLGKVTITDATPCAARPARLALLLRSHKLTVSDGPTIAGRPTTLLELKSRRGLIRRRLWVDTGTFVVLRSEIYSMRGGLLSSTAYDSIQFTGSLPKQLFKCPVNLSSVAPTRLSAREMSYGELGKAVGFEVTVPEYVPRGYKLDSYRLYTCPRSGRKSAFTRYSNGLDAISIFETLTDRDCYGPNGCCRMPGGRKLLMREAGPGQMVVFTRRDRTFVIIADLSRPELRRLARSLK